MRFLLKLALLGGLMMMTSPATANDSIVDVPLRGTLSLGDHPTGSFTKFRNMVLAKAHLVADAKVISVTPAEPKHVTFYMTSGDGPQLQINVDGSSDGDIGVIIGRGDDGAGKDCPVPVKFRLEELPTFYRLELDSKLFYVLRTADEQLDPLQKVLKGPAQTYVDARDALVNTAHVATDCNDPKLQAVFLDFFLAVSGWDSAKALVEASGL